MYTLRNLYQWHLLPKPVRKIHHQRRFVERRALLVEEPGDSAVNSADWCTAWHKSKPASLVVPHHFFDLYQVLLKIAEGFKNGCGLVLADALLFAEVADKRQPLLCERLQRRGCSSKSRPRHQCHVMLSYQVASIPRSCPAKAAIDPII